MSLHSAVGLCARPGTVACVLLLISASTHSAPTVGPGLLIEEIATVTNPLSVATPRAGSVFDGYVYVSVDGSPGGVCPGPGAQQYVDDKVVVVSSAGIVTDLATLPGESDINDLRFADPASAYGDLLYGAANNRDGYRNCD